MSNSPKPPVHLLSIDFDFWYPGKFEYPNISPSHCGRCSIHKKCTYHPIPRPTLPVEECSERYSERYKETLKFAPPSAIIKVIQPGCSIFAAECHADIARMMARQRRKFVVYDLDFHDDRFESLYLKNNQLDPLDCGNWILHAEKNAGADVCKLNRGHLEDAANGKLVFDSIFVCKSSPYLLEEGDEPLYRFLLNIQKKSKTKIRFTGHRSEELKAEFQAFLERTVKVA